jgi:hypothetical protein
MSDPGSDDEYYADGGVEGGSDDDDEDGSGMGGMDPDHPLLARAQAALKTQLLATRLGLDEKIREKTEELNVRARTGPGGPFAPICERARQTPNARSALRCTSLVVPAASNIAAYSTMEPPRPLTMHAEAIAP